MHVCECMSVYMYVCVRACAHARARVCMCVRACTRARVCVCSDHRLLWFHPPRSLLQSNKATLPNALHPLSRQTPLHTHIHSHKQKWEKKRKHHSTNNDTTRRLANRMQTCTTDVPEGWEHKFILTDLAAYLSLAFKRWQQPHTAAKSAGFRWRMKQLTAHVVSVYRQTGR